jgi:hypothetical protein
MLHGVAACTRSTGSPDHHPLEIECQYRSLQQTVPIKGQRSEEQAMRMDRRRFAAGMSSAVGATALLPAPRSTAEPRDYRGPNVVIVRFGGGVRRAEVLNEAVTFAPYLRKVLASRGVLLPNVSIAEMMGVDTSHAEGTLNILTGRYASYTKVGARGLAPLLEPQHPTRLQDPVSVGLCDTRNFVASYARCY